MSKRCTVVLLILMGVVAAGASQVQAIQYVYDDLGRLVRVIDETSGQVATYEYDAVGNMLSITRSTVDELQPAVAGIDPNLGRAASSVGVTITGQNLFGATVTTDNPGIRLQDAKTSDGSVSATFVIAETARQGATTVTVDTGIGSGTVTFTVVPSLPRLTLSPRVLTVTPNGDTTLTLTLSHADAFDTVVSLSVADPGVATLSTSSVTIPKGNTTAPVSVSGKKLGATTVTATADTRAAAASIYVSEPFTGTVTAAAAAVSVKVPEPPSSPLAGGTFAAAVSVGVPSPGISVATLGAFARPLSVLVPEAAAPLSELPSFAPPVSVQVSE